jgi:hypothetical protein
VSQFDEEPGSVVRVARAHAPLQGGPVVIAYQPQPGFDDAVISVRMMFRAQAVEDEVREAAVVSPAPQLPVRGVPMTRRRACRRPIDDPFDGVRTPQQRGVGEALSGRPIVGVRKLLVEADEMVLATDRQIGCRRNACCKLNEW